MRHTRTRRRFKFILALLLIACLMIFVENRIEAFVPMIREFAELKAERTFNDRVKLSIGSIDGGIVHPFVFNDIKIKDAKGSTVFTSVDIASIRTDYRIWDVLLSVLKEKKTAIPEISGFLSKDSPVYITFAAKEGNASGFLKLEGGLENSRVKGYVNISGMDRVNFEGRVAGDSFDIEIRPANGSLKAEGTISDNGTLAASIKVNHIKLYGFDIACDLILRNGMVYGASGENDSRIEGEIETKGLVLNYMPFFDVKSSYKLSRGLLEVSHLGIGDIVKGQAKITLRKPYDIDAVFTANNANLNWLLSSLGVKEAASVISGTLNGKLTLSGKLASLKSDVHMEIRKGTLMTLDFDYLDANLKGDGPIVRIEDSRITRQSGYFVLAGEMDLRKIGKNNLFSEVKLVSDDRAISWDGLDMAKLRGVQEFRMEKKLSDEVSLDFKKFITEEKVDESVGRADEVALEYRLHPKDSLRMMLGQDKDFLGFEHKDKF